ncbi:phosphoglycerate mutase family protein, partial [uncultured Enterococcus sp.]|uniref:phosphoglycerate mutase family protein n=1 Tax=uncultured Enterococcus sp. TaxID=167972 RepID=UPI00258847CE
MKKKLYLMRHGETLFNQLKKVQGACDSPLTENGIQQALRAKSYFKETGIHFDHLYACLLYTSDAADELDGV